MISLKNRKKLTGAIALCAMCGLIAGCDGGNRQPPRHAHRGEYHRAKHHGNRHRPVDGSRHHGHRRHASLAGAYTAIALNDEVMPKGTEIALNVDQGEDESLRLVDPTGKSYPIHFNAATGTGDVAGGSLSLREDGNFVYNDAHGGVWLVMPQ